MKQLKNIIMIVAGNTLYASAVVLFVAPGGLVTGGTTGMALFFQRLAGLPVPVFVGAFNALMFLTGLLILGKKFALTTAFSSVYYPVILVVLEKLFASVERTQDLMLATVCGGLLIGAGIGMVIRAGASTGGMDIPPLVLNKKLNIPVAYSLYAFDLMILLLQAVRAEWNHILYGIIMILIYTVVLDKVLVMGNSKLQIKIISKEYEKINHAVQTVLDRGTTLFEVEGGYLREESYAVLTVLGSRELPKLNEIVKSIDPKAFLIINQVTEVRGRGFTLEKHYVTGESETAAENGRSL